MKLTRLLPAIPLTLFVLAAQQQVVESYGVSAGLLNPYIQALAPGSRGLLWVGTRNGLFHFDGHHATRYTTAEGLPDNNVLCLRQQSSGRLWIGTWKGLAFKDPGQPIHAAPLPELQFTIPSQGIDFLPGGPVLVTTRKGILAIREASAAGPWRTDLLHPSPVPATSVLALPNGHVLYGCGLGVCEISPAGHTAWGEAEGLPAVRRGYYLGLLQTSDGTLWARSSSALFRKAPASARFEALPTATVPPIFDTYPTIFPVPGGFAVPTHRGLALWRNSGFHLLNRQNGLPGADVTTSALDSHQTLWLGTSGAGLARLPGVGRVEGYSRHEGFPGDRVYVLVPAPGGHLWAGTNDGLNLGRPVAGHWQWRSHPLPGVTFVRDLRYDSQHLLWVLSNLPHLLALDASGRVVRHSGSLPGQPQMVLPTRDGSLFVSSTFGLTRVDPLSGAVQPQTLLPNQPSPAIGYLAEDADGCLWAASYRGLFRRRHGQWRHFDQSAGLRSNMLAALAPGAAGHTFLSYFTPAPIARLACSDGPLQITHDSAGDSGRQIHTLHQDSQQRLWVFSDRGLTVLAGGQRIPLGPASGLLWSDLLTGAWLQTGPAEFWLGSADGLLHLTAPPSLPDVTGLVSRLFVNGQLLEPYPGITITNPNVLVQLASSAIRPDAQHRYRLGGDWVEVHGPEFTLPLLARGRHTLELSTRLTEGDWSPPQPALQFEYQPPWTTNEWAALAFALGIAPASLLAFRYRTRRRVAAAEARQRELESLIAQRTSQLNAAMRVKSEFVANMSHEIRTPMNAILGMSQLAAATPPGPEQREYLETVSQAASSLLTLVNDILDLSRLESGKFSLYALDFPLERPLHGVIDALRLPASAKSLDLRLTVAPDVPRHLRGDEHRLRQVLLNLLGNAVKFTHQGFVELAVSANPADPCHLRFAVTDTGPGVPPDKQQLIFEPFTQADGSTTREFGGSGLGLTISAQLATRMGGRLWLESPWREPTTGLPVTGSRFFFTAQFAPGEVSPPALPAPPAAQPSRSLRLLVAEDNAVNRRLIERVLTRAGHTVVLAEDGQQALDCFLSSSFDLILMDVQMPRLDGLTATTLIRQHNPTIPIVAVTANALPGDRDRCLAAGMTHYLPKPIPFAELERILNDCPWPRIL